MAKNGKEWQRNYPEGGKSSGNPRVLAKKQFSVSARFGDHVPCHAAWHASVCQHALGIRSDEM